MLPKSVSLQIKYKQKYLNAVQVGTVNGQPPKSDIGNQESHEHSLAATTVYYTCAYDHPSGHSKGQSLQRKRNFGQQLLTINKNI